MHLSKGQKLPPEEIVQIRQFITKFPLTEKHEKTFILLYLGKGTGVSDTK